MGTEKTPRPGADPTAVPPGYKRTEVGVLPEEWSVRPLYYCAGVKTGPFGSALHERDYVSDGTPIITVEHLSDRGVVHENLPLISDFDRNRLSNYSLRSGDIVFSRVGSVDRNALISSSEDGWLFSGRLLRVRLLGSSVHPAYLSHHFHFEGFKDRVRAVAVGQTMASLNTQILKGISVVLPPVEEQRAIAAALSDADGLIGSLEKLIEKKRAIKRAAMQQLLTGKTRLPGFSGEWKTKRLGDAFKVRHGRSQHEVAIENGRYPILASGGEIGRTNTALYERQSVLIGRKGTIDTPQYADTPFWTVDTLFYTEIIDDNSARYLFYRCCMVPWMKYNEASGVPSLNASTIEGIELELPPPREQRAIAAVLSDMDAGIEALERRLEKTRAVKQGMMQQLLTGRVRLV